MGWLIALGVIVLIGLLPVGLSVHYDSDGLYVTAFFGLVRLRLFPGKQKKEQKKKQTKEKKQGDTAPKGNHGTKKQTGGKLTDFLPLVKIAGRFLNGLRKKLCVSELHFRLILASNDPAELAMQYASGWAITGNILPLLDGLFAIKKRDIQVQCDFVAEDTQVYLHMRLHILLAKLLGLLIRYGLQAIREYYKIKKQEGGASS